MSDYTLSADANQLSQREDREISSFVFEFNLGFELILRSFNFESGIVYIRIMGYERYPDF